MISSFENHAGRWMMDAKSRPVTIMLVDDDADCRMLVRDAISEGGLGNPVMEAADGREALRLLKSRADNSALPGLIFLDIEMPGMDGQETLKRIRSDERFRDIPIVMMTGVADERQMEQAAKNGANSYTIKPANAEQFLRTVLASTNYWLTIHQYPRHHLPQEQCRR